MTRSLLKYFILIIILLPFNYLIAQKEANVWYFGEYLGLDFNSGQPQKLSGMMRASRNCASMSDSSGNFLFATNGEAIWNRDKVIMQNGDSLKGSRAASAGVLIIKKPGSDHLYYVFTVPSYQNTPGLYYSVVDMDLDNGLGAVTQYKNIPLSAAWDGLEKLTAVKHTNGQDVWVITRKSEEVSYAAFLLTSTGIDDEPVISFSPERPVYFSRGSMKISYDKKYFITANATIALPEDDPYARFDVNRFNASTGEINFMYSVRIKDDNYNSNQQPNSIEFSPDSKLAYLCTWTYTSATGDSTEYRVYQYDMTLVEDSAQFVQSALLITHKGGTGLQLATDGKIYCGKKEYFDPATGSFVNVIHYPWKRGTACYFEEDAIDFGENDVVRNLPNILLDYLYRFEWEGHCSADPFYFQSNFQPDPAFIEWNFADPLSGSNNISHDINPIHTLLGAGNMKSMRMWNTPTAG